MRKVCIITGGNSGIGLMTAVGLAKSGSHVFIACRDATKAAPAVDFIRHTTGNPDVEFLPLDLASLDSVRNFVKLFQERHLPLHILVNNAGIFNKRGTTQEGFELIWGINYLGHFLLTNLLLENLKSSAPSRIIMVASDLALRPTSIKWELFVKKTPFNFLELYAVSKLCLLLLTTGLALRLNNTNVTVNAVHPGFVQSNITIWHRLSKYLGFGISPENGAASTLFCATSPALEGVSGKFFDSQAQEMYLPKVAQDVELAEELWERSCLWTGCDRQKSTVAIEYDGTDGIWGPYSLALNSTEIAAITKTIFEQVLPKPPSNFLLVRFVRLILQLKFGSSFLLLVQCLKKEFHMERHLDSAAVWKLCQERELLQKLKEHLGEDLILWRSELWANYPFQQLLPFWHQDSYPKLLSGVGKSINAYIALTEVNELNGFEYIPSEYLTNNLPVKVTDPFSGNHFFELTNDMEERAVPVVLRPGEFIFFTEQLVHRSVRNTSGQVRLSLTLRVIQPGVRIQPGYTPNPCVTIPVSLCSSQKHFHDLPERS